MFGQLGIFCSLIVLSQITDPLNNLPAITAVALCLHIFIMFQDIATDSLVIDVVPEEQQGKANSFMWGSKTIGTSISFFAGSWLISQYGFSVAVLTMSVSVFFILFVPMFIRERDGEKLLPWTKGKISPDAHVLKVHSWKKLFKSFAQVIFLNNTLLLLTAVFVTMAALHFLRTLLPLFTIQELGWTNVYYSRIFSISSLIGGITGMVLGAVIIHHFGILRLIETGAILMIVLAVLMAFSTSFWKDGDFVSGFIAIFCTLLTLINIGVLAMAMHLCWKRISAFQFTFCMTIFNAGLATGAALLGFLRTYLDWQMLFIVFAGLITASMFCFGFINTHHHLDQVDSLEKKYLQILEEEGHMLTESEAA